MTTEQIKERFKKFFIEGEGDWDLGLGTDGEDFINDCAYLVIGIQRSEEIDSIKKGPFTRLEGITPKAKEIALSASVNIYSGSTDYTTGDITDMSEHIYQWLIK